MAKPKTNPNNPSVLDGFLSKTITWKIDKI
jgi:hypothetical protein